MDRDVAVVYRASTAAFEAAHKRMSGTVRDFAREVQRGQQQAQQALRSTLDFARENEQHFNTLGKTALATGAAVAFGLKQAFDASKRFESAFAGVRKTVDATEAEFSRLSAGIRQMALDIPVTAEEIAGIGEAAGQLGIATGNILDFSRVMADLGVATNLTSEQAATALARLANITQMPQTEFDRLGSTIVALGNSFATTEAEIVDMGLRLAGAGAQVGLAEADILALSTALSSVGINAEAGGSAISRVMIEIASQVETSGDKLDDFAAVAGMNASRFAQAWREDAASALVAFVEGLGSMEERGGSTLQVLEDLEITEIRMRDALLRSAGAGDLMRQALELGNTAWQENNALTREAEQRYGTTESRIQMARNAVNDLMISVGDQLAPVIGGAADAVGDFASSLADLPEPVLQIGAGLATLAAAAGVGGGALLLLLPRIAATQAALSALGLSMTAIMGPMGVLSAGLVAGTLLYNRYAESKREAAQRTLQLKEALEAEAAGREGSVQDMLREELARRGILSQLDRYGLTIGDVERAIRNENNAREELFNTLGEQVLAMDHLGGTLGDHRVFMEELRGSINELVPGYREWVAETEAAKTAQSELNAEWVRSGDEGERHTRVLHLLRGGSRAAADETEDLAAQVGDLGDAAADTVPEVEKLTDAQKRLADAMRSWETPLGIYQELLAEKEEAERKSAQATADATESSKDSWEDYASNVTVTLDELAQRLEEQNTAYREWEDNLLTVAGRVGADVAMILADMGEEGVHVAAAMADGTDEEVGRMAAALRDNAKRGTDDAARELEAGFLLMEHLATVGADRTVQAMAKHLGVGADEVAAIVNDYAAELAAGLNPVLEGISANAIIIGRMGRRRAANTGRTTTGISEFADGGFRPDAHITHTPVVLYGEPETGGEAYIPLAPAKEPRSRAIWEEVGRRKGWQFFADGGFRSVDDVPKPPSVGYGPFIGYTADQAMQHVYGEAIEWLAENLAPALSPGIGWQAMWEAVKNQFPWAALHSAYRPGAITATGNPSYHGMGRAIDITPSMEIFNWLVENYGRQAREIIFSPAGRRQIRNGAPHMYSGITRAMHWDHIHFAMANGGIIGEPVVGLGLRSGQSYAFGERGPEAVLPMADGGIVMPPLGQITTVAGRAAPSVASLRAALDEIDRLIARYEQLLRLQEENARRSELLADRQRAEKELAKATGDERKRAQERLRDAIVALQEFDRDRARANAEAAAQQQRLRIEEQLRIAENKAAWEFERMSAREQLRNIERRLAAEVRFTDAWMDLVRERERVAARVLDEERDRLRDLERTRDDAHQRLVRLLEDEQRIRQRMADAERRAAEESQRIVQARRDALAGWADLDRRANIDFGTSAAAISANIRDQIDAFEQWQQGLDELRARGLSEDVIAMLGLEDSPMALGQVQRFLADTDAELRELNRLVEERSRQVADRVKFEQDRLIGEVGRGLRGVAQNLAGELRDLNRELRDVGKDQGLSYGKAVAEGLRSSLAEVRKAARDLERAMAGVDVAESRVSQAEQTAAKAPPAKAVSREDAIPAKFRGGIVYRVTGTDEHYLKLGGKWYAATGAGQVAGVTSLYGAAREVPRNHIGPVADSVVNLFGGPGGIERLLASLPKFHSGIGSVPGTGERLAVVEGGERILSRVDNAMLVAAVRQAVTQPAAIGPVNVTARVFVGNQEITDIARVEAEVVVADQLREVAVAAQQVRGGR